MRHIAILPAILLISIMILRPASAQESWWDDVSVSAAFGGALPYSAGAGGYLVTRIYGADQKGQMFRFSSASPFGTEVRKVFDGRPQIGLGGRYRLGQWPGGVKVSVRAMISAGVEPAEGPRPVVGLAGVSVLF